MKGSKEMSKKVSQSKKAKEEFSNELLDFNILRSDKVVYKQDLQKMFNISERKVRLQISKISMYYPVISKSCQKGYRLAKPIDTLNKEDLQLEVKEVNHVLKELQSRVIQLKAKMKPLIAWKKVAEKKLEEMDGLKDIKIEIYRKDNE